MLAPCRFTSFTVENAGKTAKSWSVPAIGKEQNARNAVRPNSRRNCRFSLPAWAARTRQHPLALDSQNRAAVAGLAFPTPTEVFGLQSFYPNRFIGRLELK